MGEKINKIISALSSLESDMESLKENVLKMQNDLKLKTQNEIELLTEKTKKLAMKESDMIISQSQAKAEIESEKIIKTNDDNLVKLKKKIDDTLDDVVTYIVELALKKP